MHDVVSEIVKDGRLDNVLAVESGDAIKIFD